jgi:hypothetical protein
VPGAARLDDDDQPNESEPSDIPYLTETTLEISNNELPMGRPMRIKSQPEDFKTQPASQSHHRQHFKPLNGSATVLNE